MKLYLHSKFAASVILIAILLLSFCIIHFHFVLLMHWVEHSNTKINKLLQSYKMNHVWTAKFVWFIVLFALCSIKIWTVIWKSRIRQMSPSKNYKKKKTKIRQMKQPLASPMSILENFIHIGMKIYKIIFDHFLISLISFLLIGHL